MMRYSGGFIRIENDEAWVVTEAIISERRISLDYIESGVAAHLEATSSNGKLFKGSWGYTQVELGRYDTELALYKAADGEILLLGKWWNHDEGTTGDWLIHLQKPATR